MCWMLSGGEMHEDEEKVQGFLCLTLISHFLLSNQFIVPRDTLLLLTRVEWRKKKVSEIFQVRCRFQCSLKCKFRIQTSTTARLSISSIEQTRLVWPSKINFFASFYFFHFHFSLLVFPSRRVESSDSNDVGKFNRCSC